MPGEGRKGLGEERSRKERPTDEPLKALLIENLAEYFELLILAYQDKLITFVCLHYHQRYAEDIVQETFINAYKALSTYPVSKIQELNLLPWLITIARNLYLNHHRKVSKTLFLSNGLPEEELLNGIEDVKSMSPEVEMEWKEACDKLHACIRCLPMHLRLPVVLHYFVELEYHEIAEILLQPLNTVKSNGRRALAQLRKMMEEEGSNR